VLTLPPTPRLHGTLTPSRRSQFGVRTIIHKAKPKPPPAPPPPPPKVVEEVVEVVEEEVEEIAAEDEEEAEDVVGEGLPVTQKRFKWDIPSSDK
jgi:hypothetical protein